MAKKVFVTRELPARGLEMLRKYYDVEVNPWNRPLKKQELMEAVQGKDALLPLLTDNIDEDIISSNPDLKIIANYAVGYNNIDVDAATKKGIFVSNTPGVLTETTADFAWTLLMAVSRRLCESERYLREGKFTGWDPLLFLGSDIYNKTLGIVGMGRIGKAVAKRASAFNMKVLYYKRNPLSKEEEQELGLKYCSLDELLKESDFISLHTPLTQDTKHLIGADEFKIMKNTSYIINTARGPVIDEKALVEALENKEIAGAALDVFENEPEVEEKLYNLDNAVLAPHIGSATYETRSKMAEMAAQNIIAVLNNENEIPNLVNTELKEA